MNEQCGLPSFSIFSDRYFSGCAFRNERDAGDFTTFYHCWRLAGDNTAMLESPVECWRLGNYGNPTTD